MGSKHWKFQYLISGFSLHARDQNVGWKGGKINESEVFWMAMLIAPAHVRAIFMKRPGADLVWEMNCIVGCGVVWDERPRWTELARKWVTWRIRPIRFNFVCLPAAGKFQLQQLDHCLHFPWILHWISRRSQVPMMQRAKQICLEPFT